MKKLLILAGMAAVLACCAPSAKAYIGVTTNHTPVNISIVVTTNGVEKEPSSDVYTEATGKAKISNTTLKKIFAGWAGVASFPAGAMLVIGWDSPWDGDVLVVDSTGKYVLFDASSNIDDYFTVTFTEDSYYDYGAYSYNENENDPGYEDEVYSDYGEFTFYDDYVYLPYTYLYGDGLTKISYKQHWNADGDYTTWSQSTDLEDAEATSYEDMAYLDYDIYYITATGNVDSSGSGKGESYEY